MDPIVLAPLVLLLFLGSSKSSRRRTRRPCEPRIFVFDGPALDQAIANSVYGGAQSVEQVVLQALAAVYPTYPGLDLQVTWANPNADQSASAELRVDAICLKNKVSGYVRDQLNQVGIPPFPQAPGGAPGGNGGAPGGNGGAPGGNGGTPVGEPGQIVDTGVAVTPPECQAQGFPVELTYRVVVSDSGTSYRVDFYDWVQQGWRPIRDGADWLEEGSPLLMSTIQAANELGVEAIEDLISTCGGGGGPAQVPGITTPETGGGPPGQVPGLAPGGALPPIDWGAVESGQGPDDYPEPGTVMQVRQGDIFLGTYSPLNLGTESGSTVRRSIVYMTLLSAGALAAIEYGVGDPDEPGIGAAERAQRQEAVTSFARQVAFSDANRIEYLQLIQCSPINDAIYATYGYGPKAFPSPVGRAIRMLPYHFNNKKRLTEGQPWRRNIELGTPSDRELGNAGRINSAGKSYPLLYLPAINLQILWESGGTVITTEGMTWPDGSNGIMPPPELMARGVADVPDNMLFGCAGYEVEVG